MLAQPSDPRQQLGLYWGYQTRIATSVKQVLDSSPYQVRRVFIHSWNVIMFSLLSWAICQIRLQMPSAEPAHLKEAWR